MNGNINISAMQYLFLDSLMEYIPGKDNQDSFIKVTPLNRPNNNLYSASSNKKGEELNAACNHRAFYQYDREINETRFDL